MLLALQACSLFSQAPATSEPPVQAPPPSEQPALVPPTSEEPGQELPTQASPTTASGAAPTTATSGTSGPIRQWAADAEASSEWGSSDWVATQAAGGPNTPECGDFGTAWASSGSNTVEWINLYVQVPVYPTEVHIIQTYNPDQVVRIDLIDMQGEFVTVYTGQPKVVDDPCPYLLSIPISQSDILVQGVRVTIDQSVLGLGWNEIDAVEIVGAPGEGTPVRPASPTP
jgi:hypothetical protein